MRICNRYAFCRKASAADRAWIGRLVLAAVLARIWVGLEVALPEIEVIGVHVTPIGGVAAELNDTPQDAAYACESVHEHGSGNRRR